MAIFFLRYLVNENFLNRYLSQKIVETCREKTIKATDGTTMLYSSAILATGALSTSYILSKMFPDCQTAVNWVVFFMTLLLLIILLFITFQYYQHNASPISSLPDAMDTGNYDSSQMLTFFTTEPIASWRASDPVAYDYCLKLLASHLTDRQKDDLLDTFTVFAYKPGYEAYAAQLESYFS